MGTPLCKLTLVCPLDIRVSISDALDALDPQIPGYTVVEGLGHGPEAALLSSAERVHGAMRTAIFLMILPRTETSRVLAGVAETIQRPQLAYWIEPVDDYGRLA